MSEDRRIHPRVHVVIDVEVSGPKGKMKGRLRDLSKGGAGIYLERAAAELGEDVEIFLPYSNDLEITVSAELLRVSDTEFGKLHSLRFNVVEPALQDKLLQLIDLLLDHNDDTKREYPRVSKRLPVTYGALEEYKAILENISVGGFSMVVDKPLVLFEELEVSIPDPSGSELLVLSSRVIYQHSFKRDGQALYRVGLQFSDLTDTARNCLKELIREVVKMSHKDAPLNAK